MSDVTAAGTAPPVLVLRALGLGDALTGVPALRGLRRAFPGSRLVLAAPAGLGSWLAGLGLVDGVVDVAGLDGPPPGRGLGRHIAVDLHGRGPQSHRLLAEGGPVRLVGFGGTPYCDGPVWDPDEHEVRRWCRLVRGVGGACRPADLRLPELGTWAPRPGPPTVVLHPGAAAGARRWPPARWARLAAWLDGERVRVRITGSAREAGLAADIAHRAGLDPAAAATGGDLDALAGELMSATVLVCGDTGVAHVATALGLPSVLLFGPTPPHLWGPAIDAGLHTVLWHGSRTGDPHATAPDPALLRITTEEVRQAVTDLLGHVAPQALTASSSA